MLNLNGRHAAIAYAGLLHCAGVPPLLQSMRRSALITIGTQATRIHTPSMVRQWVMPAQCTAHRWQLGHEAGDVVNALNAQLRAQCGHLGSHRR